ncbi:MAG: hypothetical protein HY751_06460 [Nitrospinae bacterium]|nr:hypothetical protein [Nitrospinota bacterium]
MTPQDEQAAEAAGIPRGMKTALITNMAGMVFMLLSLYAKSPFQFVVTLVSGTGFLLASFALWLWMVFTEARVKGMFR